MAESVEFHETDGSKGMVQLRWIAAMAFAGVVLLVAAVVVHSLGRQPAVDAVDVEAPADGIFEGTITSIEISNPRDPINRWVATFRVDRVITGSDPGKPLRVAIHSPSLSGLKMGEKYELRATRTLDDYQIDNWRPIARP